MVNIFDYTEYHLLLQNLTTELVERKQTQGQLAKAIGCQASYFSQVLKGKVQLTEDHGYKLCEFMGWDSSETEYFLILLRISRAGTATLVKYLEQQVTKIQNARNSIDGRVRGTKIEADDALISYYCGSWIPSVLHAATSCESFQTVPALSARLRLSKTAVEYHLLKLEKYNLVKHVNSRWTHCSGSMHFSKNSPLDSTFQLNRRLLAMNSMIQRDPSDVHYSVVFTANEQTMKNLQQIVLSAIEKLAAEIEPAPMEDLYSFCVDLFRV